MCDVDVGVLAVVELGSCCDASAVAPTAARTAARTARSMIFCMSGDTIRA